MRRVIIALDDGPPAVESYACPVCGAVPEQVRVVRIKLDAGVDLTPEQARQQEERRTVLRFLAEGDKNSPRARAVAELTAKRKNQSGTEAGRGSTTASRRTA